ncbi:MAG: hypothetical protein IJ188_03275 [Clostridia bacterium]|nr:hypothetical protein [Clostridia bacterium]
MAKGITGKEADPRMVYGDIIDLPAPKSKKHPAMSLYDRAPQFAPFAALTGYDDMIQEEARLTDERIEMGEDALNQLNLALQEIAGRIQAGEQPRCSLTYFVPDPMKAGGAYVTRTEEVRRVDLAAGKLILCRKEGYGDEYATVDLHQLLEVTQE